MPIIARVANAQSVYLTGGSYKELLPAANALGKRLSLAIANNFQDQRTYLGTLKANDPDYDVRKILAGYSPLRGHRTGELQRVLSTAPLYYVRPSGDGAVIRFTDSGIRGALPYAKYYAEAKVLGGRIAGVRVSWTPDMNAFLRRLKLPQPARKPRRRRSRALASTLARTRRNKQRTTVEVGQ